MSESDVQIAVADYLRLQYPDVLFHSDFGSGVKLTPGQAAKQKRQNGGRRAWPDMEIAKPRCLNDPYSPNQGDFRLFYGLYIELKKDGENLYAKRNLDDPRKKSIDGRIYADEHIKEQADTLYKLRQEGYCAKFAVGLDEAKKIIDEYLGGKKWNFLQGY